VVKAKFAVIVSVERVTKKKRRAKSKKRVSKSKKLKLRTRNTPAALRGKKKRAQSKTSKRKRRMSDKVQVTAPAVVVDQPVHVVVSVATFERQPNGDLVEIETHPLIAAAWSSKPKAPPEKPTEEQK
jgi:hypothetical protein